MAVGALTPAPPPVAPSAPPLPTFRLGTAASLFGWSTTIGDLNGDQTPDLVIADREFHRATGYAYRIQFAVSGLQPRDVAFESEHEALTVRLSDVDHDSDLDVVVSAAPSREIVGIWLNDGHGRFEAADIRKVAQELPCLQSVGTADWPVDLLVLASPPRRGTDCVFVAVRATLPQAGRHPRVLQAASVVARLQFAATASRAPPQRSAVSFA